VKLVKRAILRAIRAAGYMLVPLPLGEPAALHAGSPAPTVGSPPLAIDRDRPPAGTPGATVDRFAEVEALLRLISPWSGDVPNGYSVDFLGIRTDGSFLWNKAGPFGGRPETTSLPTVASYGEAWFEVASWLLSARDAKDRYRSGRPAPASMKASSPTRRNRARPTPTFCGMAATRSACSTTSSCTTRPASRAISGTDTAARSNSFRP
jgi:hypothetical protein